MFRNRPALFLVVGAFVAVLAITQTPRLLAQQPSVTPARDNITNELRELRAEIEQLRGRLPGQAHVMVDVGQHFSGLWFAVENRNWDLAAFMFHETHSHLRWAVRVRPVRKLSDGTEVQLANILDGLENGVLDKLQSAIEKRSRRDFQKAYRATIEGCNSCHRATEESQVKVHVPARLGEPLDFRPSATIP